MFLLKRRAVECVNWRWHKKINF